MNADTPTVLLVATLATKQEEHDFLRNDLQGHGVQVITVDVSLNSGGKVLDGEAKCRAMDCAAQTAQAQIETEIAKGADAILGLGGGTGGQIILQTLRALPITYPKVLVTTLPFDPRIAVADNSIVLVPTLADISGLNPTLREVFENTAAMVAGLCQTRRKGGACVDQPSIGITALGATEGAVGPLVQSLRARGEEPTVFHANGYGGAAFARFADRGAFKAVIDLTPHEVTRIHLAGAHVSMPRRFTAAADIPKIMLPGGVNFIGLGEKSLAPQRYINRPHYQHSAFFTHAKVETDEMVKVATILSESLNAQNAPACLIVPMGGFSHEDRPDGAIEDAALREIFLNTAKTTLSSDVTLIAHDGHIFDPEIPQTILAQYDAMTS